MAICPKVSEKCLGCIHAEEHEPTENCIDNECMENILNCGDKK